MSDEAVYLTAKTLYNNKEAHALAFGPFNRMAPNEMAAGHANPYRPGAITLYNETGLWPPERLAACPGAGARLARRTSATDRGGVDERPHDD